MTDYERAQKRAAERANVEGNKRMPQYRGLTSEELRATLARLRTTPWERLAIRRVLRERGEL